jgi:DNA modification methylase
VKLHFGTTGVACVNTGRNFIGVESDAKYFNVAKKRIEAALNGTK